MLQLNRGEYVGVLFDAISEQVIESSPIIRATPDAAYRDAMALIAVVNDRAEAYEDSEGEDFSVGRVDDSYAYVQDASGIVYDYPALTH